MAKDCNAPKTYYHTQVIYYNYGKSSHLIKDCYALNNNGNAEQAECAHLNAIIPEEAKFDANE